MRAQVKIFISRLITHPIVGQVISRIWSKANFHGVQVDLRNPYLPFNVKAAIFWNIYESAEARLITRWLPVDTPVIELGASLGIISRLISSRIHKPIICVEANDSLLNSIRYNLDSLSDLDYIIIDRAISYSGQPVMFLWNKGDNLTGKINSSEGQKVESTTLSEIVEQHKLNVFTLVMDIEGTEIEILLEDSECLQKCYLLITELHICEYKGRKYLIEDLNELIKGIGFQCTARDGNCFVYQRKET